MLNYLVLLAFLSFNIKAVTRIKCTTKFVQQRCVIKKTAVKCYYKLYSLQFARLL